MSDIRELVEALLDGWVERVEFAVTIPLHTDTCNTRMLAMTIQQLRHYVCICPVTKELRAERRKQGAICLQLVERGYMVPQGGSGGPSGAKPGSKIPGDLLRPDEILSRIADVAEEWAAPAVTGQPVVQGFSAALPIPARLRRAENLLRDMAAWETDADPEEARETARSLAKVVRQARVYLGYDSEWQLFADTVCGECGGALRVERDLPAEVRCAGTPAEPPCGASYPWWTWLDLTPRLVDTATACAAAGIKAGTLYSWASRGQVRRYGGAGNGAALWDLTEIKERTA